MQQLWPSLFAVGTHNKKNDGVLLFFQIKYKENPVTYLGILVAALREKNMNF